MLSMQGPGLQRRRGVWLRRWLPASITLNLCTFPPRFVPAVASFFAAVIGGCSFVGVRHCLCVRACILESCNDKILYNIYYFVYFPSLIEARTYLCLGMPVSVSVLSGFDRPRCSELQYKLPAKPEGVCPRPATSFACWNAVFSSVCFLVALLVLPCIKCAKPFTPWH